MTKIPSKTTTTSKTLTTTTTTSTSKHGWCNLDNYDVAVQQRLNSSKDIIVVDEIDDFEIDNHNTYENAKSVCENICGRLYFPSTLKENDEVKSVLNRRCIDDDGRFWLRLAFNQTWANQVPTRSYNETKPSRTWYDHMVGTWYDPDKKENLTFLNFHHSDGNS